MQHKTTDDKCEQICSASAAVAWLAASLFDVLEQKTPYFSFTIGRKKYFLSFQKLNVSWFFALPISADVVVMTETEENLQVGEKENKILRIS